MIMILKIIQANNLFLNLKKIKKSFPNKYFFPSLFIIFFISSLAPLWSFTFNNSGEAAFDKDVIIVNVADHNCDGTTSPEDLFYYTEQAINDYWNKVPTSSLKLKRGSIISVSNNFKTEDLCLTGTSCDPNTDIKVESDIIISCNTNLNNFSTSGILGKSIPNNTSGSNIIGSLILINGRSNNLFDGLSHDEKVAVLAHEIGHAIGLGHSPVKDSLMYYSIIPNRRSLGWDDYDGVTYLYPALQPIGGGCGTIIDTNKKNPPPSGPMLPKFFYFQYLLLGLLGFLVIIFLKNFGIFLLRRT